MTTTEFNDRLDDIVANAEWIAQEARRGRDRQTLVELNRRINREARTLVKLLQEVAQ